MFLLSLYGTTEMSSRRGRLGSVHSRPDGTFFNKFKSLSKGPASRMVMEARRQRIRSWSSSSSTGSQSHIRPFYDNDNASSAPIPPELTDWLIASQDFRPGKQMSQIFLADESVAEDVVAAADVSEGDLVVEIGSGGGTLTRALVKAGGFVLAVEAVSELANELERFFDPSHVKVVNEDFLKCDIEALVKKEMGRRPGFYKSVKLLSNLPYHITTPVLQKVLPMRSVFSSAVLMLQHEAAKRFATAVPGDRDYRFMNFFVQYYSNATYLFKVGRHCYRPNPGVAGGIIRFDLIERESVPGETTDDLIAFAKLSFQSKRKTLRQTLNGFKGYSAEYIETVLEILGLSKLARAEELDFYQLVELFKVLESRTIQAKPRPVEAPKKLNW
eukprot:CAMPEP_0114491036 /NCGR_PEP_ID=MMETSP0109-20121206/2778_1 /TAXON_ID=29199 /ORGANISM="Chlorarachnion reptans, Strain CCCM449" /LENGTH=385 /DNA_ID=CAMNT_0001667727 /DNA_START=189 /DNA_END=1343 /DNA_ORIENTATION=-